MRHAILTYGGWVTILVLLPNLIALLLPPRDKPARRRHTSRWDRTMEMLERAGQVSSFIIPFFCRARIDRQESCIAAALMTMLLAIYYFCWIRYALARKYIYFYKPVLCFPLPMAWTPILFFLLGSCVLHSAYLLASTILLGIGHLYVSRREYQAARQGMSD